LDSTVIRFHVHYPATINATITDLDDKEIYRTSEMILEEGIHSISWNGADSTGTAFQAGNYRINLISGEYSLNTFLQKN
jgi:flagellar hook assembly protein FlgD